MLNCYQQSTGIRASGVRPAHPALRPARSPILDHATVSFCAPRRGRPVGQHGVGLVPDTKQNQQPTVALIMDIESNALCVKPALAQGPLRGPGSGASRRRATCLWHEFVETPGHEIIPQSQQVARHPHVAKMVGVLGVWAAAMKPVSLIFADSFRLDHRAPA
jgi:hypothetical protein